MSIFKRIESFAGIASLLPLALLAGPDSSTNPSLPPTATEPKTHTLFMGTDVFVEHNKKLGRVRDVVGGSFIVTVDGAQTTVPMRRGTQNIKIEQTLKLSSASASLTGLNAERTYTPRNDPLMNRQKEKMVVTQVLTDSSMVAMGQNNIAQSQMVYLSTIPKGDLVQWQAAVDQTQSRIDASARAMNMGNLELSSDLTSGAAIRSRAESDLAQENFDAVEISFEVASETPLTNPYLVAITHFRPRNSKQTAMANNAIYAQALDPIGDKPKRISFTQGGFPRGFTLESHEIHLYDHGVEIATNVAPNRVALTRDEAFRYLKIEYINQHKGATVPASLAMKKIFPVEKQGTAPSDQKRMFYFIKVSKEGLPLATFTDETCSQPADATAGSIAANLRFFPALEQGKPVEGVARVLLSQPEA